MALSEACLANVMLLLYAPTYTCQNFNCQCQMCQPTTDLQPTLSDFVLCENLAIDKLLKVGLEE